MTPELCSLAVWLLCAQPSSPFLKEVCRQSSLSVTPVASAAPSTMPITKSTPAPGKLLSDLSVLHSEINQLISTAEHLDNRDELDGGDANFEVDPSLFTVV